MLRRLALLSMAMAWSLAGGAMSHGAETADVERTAAPTRAGGDLLKWQALPAIPDPLGFAGPLAGVHDDVLLVAGGANFPDGMPWDGGAKAWHDDVFALRRADAKWQRVGQLPRRLGYGVSLSTPRGVACLGGSNAQGHYADCFFMQRTSEGVAFKPLPALPRPCANACGAALGDVLYVAGGIATPNSTTALRTLWRLDLARLEHGWQEFEAWPGSGRMLATMGVQGGVVYLFGGASLAAGADGKPVRTWLQDAYKFQPGRGWSKIAALPHPVVAAPSPAPAMGQSHLLLLGGDDGSQVNVAPADHKGFPRDILAYHSITDTWAKVGRLPTGLVTTPAIVWNKRIVIPGGEQRPGVRSTEVWTGDASAPRAAFGWQNFATLLAYPIGMLAIGWICARRNKSADDYFRASERIPWWAAGVSIYATMLSSLTFMAVPAKAYATDWAFFLNYASIFLLAPIIIRYYLPFFRRLNVTTAYEYLERRFNLFIRLFGSASFIAFQIGRTGIVLYLPALALSTVSNLDMTWCIVGMTLLSIALTVYGGMEAVIWTDVAQTVILLGAVIASLIAIVLQVDGGAAALWSSAHAHGKVLENVPWTLDLTIVTGWVALVGMGFTNLISYTSNQEVVQRYLTTVDEREAARAVWTNALLSLPSGLLFFCVGTGLFVFYRQQPERLDPTLATDAIFPLFILQELPAGVAGFVVAGIFAAAQPTSGLNSTAAAVVTDFYRRLWPNVSDRQALVAGRIVTVVTGLLGMSVALLAMTLSIQSIWETFLNVLGLTSGALAGLFALGIFTRRANATGATLGLFAGAATILFACLYSPIHPLLYGAVGVVSTFVFGYAFSLPFPVPASAGLTIHSVVDRTVNSFTPSAASPAASP
jgi:solute:Na+ symporter, SSS family